MVSPPTVVRLPERRFLTAEERRLAERASAAIRLVRRGRLEPEEALAAVVWPERLAA